GAGRGGDLVRSIEAAVERSAGLRNKAVAEVRAAIALSDDQQRRLAEALQQATGKDVTVKVIVDPTVMGGLVTRIGDEVIDGSVRTRINQLREAF
ncbi:MAG: ATP synthase F1 subunit delta, partial [Acidimicrobiia bacterium]|nr:ATP synthase F1 subunit delta [Acidimicrobiia bacterium]